MVFSSSAIVAKEKFGDPNYFSFKQLIFATLGLAVMFVVMKVDYHTYRHPAVVFSALAIVVALLLVWCSSLPPLRTRIVGFSLPDFPIQPSELSKLALIFFLAYFLEKRKGNVNDLTFTLIPIAVIVAFLAGLIVLQPDLGTAVSLLVISCVLAVRRRSRSALDCRLGDFCFADFLFPGFPGEISPRPHSGVPEPLGRAAGPRVSDHPIASFGGFGRHRRSRIHGRQAEALLSA